jgi:hypothetical protein
MTVNVKQQSELELFTDEEQQDRVSTYCSTEANNGWMDRWIDMDG